jgi:hypothetical protein
MKSIKIDYNESIPNNFTGIAEWWNGDKKWYKEGKLHRLDGPAIIYSSGLKYWYKEGKIHRDDGPAIESPKGTKEWCVEGKLHRLDGPAIEFPNERKEWWIEDKLYSPEKLLKLINFSLPFGKEKGQYGLEWLKFLTEEGIEEFPFIPEMKEDENFKEVFNKLEGIKIK